MKTRSILLAGILVAALALAAGCAKRQLTRAQTDRLDAIAAKLAEAEQMGARECAPKELAYARAAYDHARHEARENWEKAQRYVAEAEKAADDVLAKTKACVEARKPKEAPAPPPPAPAPEAAPAPPPAPPAAAPAPPPETVESHAFENIHFDFDKSLIREDDKPILRKVADDLKKNLSVKITIEGHCDERGTAEYNMALGERRATSAKKYLEGLGIAADRMSTVSYGKERPLDPGHNEEAWARNRRAVFVPKP
ncbi:MAG: peptidoglycan-associated lipoprotein Pal [Deltaproteobacteria bacterium]|nr:peptidoglycan-associated lipoprotein Pal [Deltaproteobacteria bacterium]